MTDILIRGVEMPQNCFECALFSNCDSCEGYECYCGAIGAIGYCEAVPKDSRREDCPLVELPQHGDLCDRSVILAQYDTEHEGEPGRARTIIMNAPVVVPAERRDEDEKI